MRSEHYYLPTVATAYAVGTSTGLAHCLALALIPLWIWSATRFTRLVLSHLGRYCRQSCARDSGRVCRVRWVRTLRYSVTCVRLPDCVHSRGLAPPIRCLDCNDLLEITQALYTLLDCVVWLLAGVAVGVF